MRLTVGMAFILAALPQAAQAQQQQRTLTAIGASSSPVTPTDPRDNASILEAIVAAKSAGIGPAFASARARAEQLAQAAGVTLGEVQAVEDGPGGPFGFFGGGPHEHGTFGPGRFCATVPRFVTRRGPGRRIRRVRKGSRRICRFPNLIETRISVTYAISG